MKALVTGGAGFIGSHLCERLLQENYEVVCFDNYWRGSEENLKIIKENPNATLMKGDIMKPAEVQNAVKDCDVVYHLAAINGTKYFYEQPVLITSVNVQGTQNVLEASTDAGVKRFVFASSPEVYGEPTEVPTPETGLCTFDNPITTPRHAYSASKYLGEILTQSFMEKKNLQSTIIRYFNVYGPRLIGTDYGQVASMFIKSALEKKQIRIFGDGKQTRSFTYIADAIEGTLKASEIDKGIGEAFNIGNPKETSIEELANMIIANLGGSIEKVHDDMPAGDASRRCPDTTKAKELLGFEAAVPLEEGLNKTIEWFKQ